MGCKGTKEKSADDDAAQGNATPMGDDRATDASGSQAAKAEHTRRASHSGSNGTSDDDEDVGPQHAYRCGGPRSQGRAFPCFREGLLYRIVNEETWSFYNDTKAYEMHVEYRFGPDSVIESLGEASMHRDEHDGWITVHLIVYPVETKPFMVGEYRGYRCNISAVPLSQEYRERIMRNSERDANEEMDRLMRRTAAFADDPARVLDRCVDADWTVAVTSCAQSTAGGDEHAHNHDARSDAPTAKGSLATSMRTGTTNATAAHGRTAKAKRPVLFVDTAFPPLQKSLSRAEDKRQLAPTAWLRPRTYLAGLAMRNGAVLEQCLLSTIDPTDIDQGALGNCWFLCALAAIAEYPQVVRDMFKHPISPERAAAEQHVGAYRITLTKHGWWTTVIVDDFLPCVGGLPCFAKNVSNHGEMWVALLEKTYAKLHGSYAATTGGDHLHAMQDLTGYPTARFDNTWEAARRNKKLFGSLFDDIARYVSGGGLATLNTPGVDSVRTYAGSSDGIEEVMSRYKRAGLGMGHAYLVLETRHFPEEHIRLLKIRNPWAAVTGDWTGDWSRSSWLWQTYPDIAASCGHDPDAASDGAFWMDWTDARAYFDGGGVCFTRFGWYDYRVKGANEMGRPTVVLEISVREPVDAFLILSQVDKRGQPRGSPDAKYAAAMLSLADPEEIKDKPTQTNRVRVRCNTTSNADAPSGDYSFLYARDLSMRYRFEPNERPYVVVPRFHDPAVTKDFTLGLLTSSPVGGAFTVRFRTLHKDSRVFQNYLAFHYELTKPAHCQYQTRSPGAVPEVGEGTELGVPSDPPMSVRRRRGTTAA